jgi:hypothetical protein
MKCLSAALLCSAALICLTVSCIAGHSAMAFIPIVTSLLVMVFSTAAWWAATKHE